MYPATVQNIYDAPPPPPKERNETIEYIQTIVQGVQAQSYEMEGLAQANAVLTISKSAITAQLSQMTVTMNSMKAQLKHSPLHKPIKQDPKGSTTAGSEGAISLMGEKPNHQIKWYIKMKRTKRKRWVAVKRSVNDG